MPSYWEAYEVDKSSTMQTFQYRLSCSRPILHEPVSTAVLLPGSFSLGSSPPNLSLVGHFQKGSFAFKRSGVKGFSSWRFCSSFSLGALQDFLHCSIIFPHEEERRSFDERAHSPSSVMEEHVAYLGGAARVGQ